MAGLWRKVTEHKLLTRYLLFTNMLISGGIDALGDYIEQQLEHQDPVVWSRTARMSVIGLVMGAPYHYWYRFIDRLYPKRTAGAVARKVALDTLVLGPPDIALFYLGMCRLEGKTWQQSIEELKEKFLITLMLECAFWPVAQTVNFYFFPSSLRVLYVNIAHLGWAVVLSRLKHKEEALDIRHSAQ